MKHSGECYHSELNEFPVAQINVEYFPPLALQKFIVIESHCYIPRKLEIRGKFTKTKREALFNPCSPIRTKSREEYLVLQQLINNRTRIAINNFQISSISFSISFQISFPPPCYPVIHRDPMKSQIRIAFSLRNESSRERRSASGRERLRIPGTQLPRPWQLLSISLGTRCRRVCSPNGVSYILSALSASFFRPGNDEK